MPKLNLRIYLVLALFAVLLFSPIPSYTDPKTIICKPGQYTCGGWYLAPSLTQRVLGKLSKRDQPGERSKLPASSVTCTQDSDCTINTCAGCQAQRADTLDSNSGTCAMFCEVTAKCENGQCIAIPMKQSSIEMYISSPSYNSIITSPVTVTGQIPNTWVFEANFPIAILDSQKQELTRIGVQTQGDWMTDKTLDFTVTIPFATTDSTGFILIENDNPSGLPENSKSFLLPIRFK